MSYPAINTATMKVIATTDSIEQSHAHADISCPRENFIIIDDTCYGWEGFTYSQRSLLLLNLTGKELNPQIDITMQARYLNDALRKLDLDETPLEQLNGKRPHIAVVHAEGHTAEPGALKKSSMLTHRPSVKKGPSIKTVTYELMNAKINAEDPTEEDIPGLRIDLMNEMAESHPHIKRTSISTTLGQWLKERYPS